MRRGGGGASSSALGFERKVGKKGQLPLFSSEYRCWGTRRNMLPPSALSGVFRKTSGEGRKGMATFLFSATTDAGEMKRGVPSTCTHFSEGVP